MAADSLDMSLDDLITNKYKRRSRPDPAPSARRFHSRAATRAAAAPYHAITFQAPPTAYTHPTPVETGTKLHISNLDYAVSNEDIKELFSEVGDVKRYSINYDKSGRSKGTAEVVFSRKSDALAAVKRYNNVQLDGKPMKLELIGINIEPPPPAMFGFAAPAGYFDFPPKSAEIFSGPGRGGRGWPRGRGGFGGRGRGHVGRGRGRGDRGSRKISAEDLDADLDKYHAEGMQMS
ncbi:THO complex subunit 4A isoform X1 [Oryza sativa Japonica Group]|uniref:THO complex subunit 4A isoform X1 n=1 Tax=Oryza sativa subsp. japonica TaxID=39947 RepID=UPI0007753B70|nr:THO complex subunit 4A isoform X1 [Oryza sativa Japonica Group]